MTTKITWTHVDAHVRKACERIGMLPVGHGDAEVAYNYLKYVESKADLLQQEGEKMEDERDRLKIQVRKLTRQLGEKTSKGKTKQRLAALEKAVAELQNASNNSCTDLFGPRDADGWYTWNGDDTMRPAGRVDVVARDGVTATLPADNFDWGVYNKHDDIVKWRPAQ